jgi:hypothetical protein
MTDRKRRLRFHAIDVPQRVYRVAFTPDVAAFPDWIWQAGDNRFDDPRMIIMRATIMGDLRERGIHSEAAQELLKNVLGARPSRERPYRVLYTSNDRMTAYVEILSVFRRATAALTTVAQNKVGRVIEDAPDIPLLGGPLTGVVPADHLARLYVGEIYVEASPIVQIDAAQSVQYVRRELLDRARLSGLSDVSLGDILSGNRAFTQTVSRLVYEDAKRYSGISHISALGRPHTNYAIFETPDASEKNMRAMLETSESRRIALDDPELLRALQLLDIEIEALHATTAAVLGEADVIKPRVEGPPQQ